MRITIKDIARLAEVSVATASLAMNNKPGVNEDTRKKVLKIAESNGYMINHAARSLITRKSKLIGLIVTDIRNPFFSMIIEEFNNESEKHGYNLLLGISSDKIVNEKKYIDMFLNKNVEGIIVVPTLEMAPDLSHYETLDKMNIPYVFCTTSYNGIKAPCVMTDLLTGQYLVVKHLLGKGMNKIFLLTGLKHLPVSNLRINGYKLAYEEAGKEYSEDWLIETFPDYDNGYDIAKIIVQFKPDAIITINDFMALGVIKALKDLDIVVPDQISVAGYDDLFFVSLIETPLTTVRQPIADICERTFEILLDRIDNKKVSNKTIYLEPMLKIRESTI